MRVEMIPSLLLVVLCSTGCSRGRESPVASAAVGSSEAQLGPMPREKVRDIARRAAIAEGYDLKKFAAPTFAFDQEKQQWTLFFAGKVNPAPGNHFHVLVDDRTGKASVRHGA